MKQLPLALLAFSLLLLFPSCRHSGKEAVGEPLPLRGLAIEAPKPDGLDPFLTFIEEELVM